MYTEAIFSRNILIDFNIIIKYHFMVLVQEKIIRVKMAYLSENLRDLKFKHQLLLLISPVLEIHLHFVFYLLHIYYLGICNCIDKFYGLK